IAAKDRSDRTVRITVKVRPDEYDKFCRDFAIWVPTFARVRRRRCKNLTRKLLRGRTSISPFLDLPRSISMDMQTRLGAEFFGTFWLTFAGCGSAVLAAGFPTLGIGFLGVSFAFGLTVLTMAYAVGHISGGHFNSAVTVGLWTAGRFKAEDVGPYLIAQVVGAIVGPGFSTRSPRASPTGCPAGLRPTAMAISAPANMAWCLAS